MITIRKAEERGGGSHGWLETRYSFSFADYWDPRHMGYRSLRVINEDRVAPGAGFPTHPHRDMEILTYVLDGALAHRDSMGNGSTIRPGEIQKMSAGRGVTHSELNPSRDAPVHLLQIWIEPSERGLPASYAQTRVAVRDEPGRLHLLAAPTGEDGAVPLHQDVFLFGATLEPGQSIRYSAKPGRGLWLQVADGSLEVGGVSLEQGDGAVVEDESEVTIVGTGSAKAEFLLFDLA